MAGTTRESDEEAA